MRAIRQAGDRGAAAEEELGAGRIGHGVRSVEDPDLLARIVDKGVGLEVCPASNVALGVYRAAVDVPLRQLYEAGARIALGADDPLLFGSRLADQYQIARDAHDFSDVELADLARSSVGMSTAPLFGRMQPNDMVGAPSVMSSMNLGALLVNGFRPFSSAKW